jgi:hypothetical protein
MATIPPNQGSKHQGSARCVGFSELTYPGLIFPMLLADTIKSNTVLKVLIARELLHDWDTESLKFSLIADTGLHQHFR